MTLELTFTEEGKNSDQLSDLRTPSSSQTGQQYISLYATESRPSTVMLTRIIFFVLFFIQNTIHILSRSHFK